MKLKQIINSKPFIILSIHVLLLSSIIGYLILKPKTKINELDPDTQKETELKQPSDATEYHTALKKWLTNSPIRKVEYTAEEIRKILGRSQKVLYEPTGAKNDYTYKEGLFWDSWQINGVECNTKIYQLYNTTPPPIAPDSITTVKYYDNGSHLLVEEKDSTSNKTVKETLYDLITASLHSVTEYDPGTGKTKKITTYYSIGTRLCEEKYDFQTGSSIETTYYNSDGIIPEDKKKK
ncbi:hypothetical protein [Candidatus Phytoplasma pruni]|uniref:DUF2963 domain-containing protein n=1 Tax=Candidatus Phytoplasma pruni TaxID=479893 RepID=A0A851HCQ5_9MOLU|nr:hypothetical protein [Candidatus Phytoplasma pruni]NWN45768.1 hypothetical protein [Candidatus Phytoplasma pruni]